MTSKKTAEKPKASKQKEENKEAKPNAEEKEAKAAPNDGVLREGMELPPLEKGLRYFLAPDGRVLVGEADKTQLWDRKLNNGRGGWINPMR